MKNKFALLNEKFVYYSLLTANLFSALLGFYMGRQMAFNDAVGYWNMGKSIGHGTFSSWYFLPFDAPETLRTWGYPFFIFLCQQIYDSFWTVQILQFLLFGFSVYLVLRLIKHFDAALIYRNVFLLILAVNIKIPFYTGQINADILCIFFVVLYGYIYYVLKESLLKSLLMAICGFCLFQLKPAFLLFPFFFLIYKLIFKRENLKLYGLQIFLYSIFLVPFAVWNYNNHGVFKVTPIEGGGGVLHLAVWCPKLPENYRENFYWGNVCVNDLTEPNFVSSEEREKNVVLFENEWREINTQLEPFFGEEDKQKVTLMSENNPGQFILYSGRYTNEREKLLIERTVQHIKEEPWLYAKTRLYTLCRVWFTGINKDEWNNSNSFTAKAKLIYPFLSTFIFIFLGFIFTALSFALKIINWRDFYFLFLLAIYYGAIHIPFAVQSRFTVPVHLLILLMSSFAIVNMLGRKYNDKQQSKNF